MRARPLRRANSAASLIATSIAVAPSSEKKTLDRRFFTSADADNLGPEPLGACGSVRLAAWRSFWARIEAGSFARPREELWAIFANCFRKATLIRGWLWPWRLVQIDELASRYSWP